MRPYTQAAEAFARSPQTEEDLWTTAYSDSERLAGRKYGRPQRKLPLLSRPERHPRNECSWRQFLKELKAFFASQDDFRGNARKTAEQAELFEAGVRFALSQIPCVYPSLKMSDRLFSEVFGFAGQQIINKKEAEAKADVLAYMVETSIEDEQEARKKLREELEAGLAAATLGCTRD